MQKTDDAGTGGVSKTSLTPSSRGEEEEIKAYVKEHHVALNTKDAPNPILSFDKCHEIFPMEIVAALKKQGYEKPTPIQALQLTIALTGEISSRLRKQEAGKRVRSCYRR